MDVVCLDTDATAPDFTCPSDRILPSGLAPSDQAPGAENLALTICQLAVMRSSHTAVLWHGRPFRYDWFLAAATLVRDDLLARPEFCPAARVVIAMENSPEYLAALYGVLLADGVAVPIAPNLERERFQEICHSCTPAVVLCRGQERTLAILAEDFPTTVLQLHGNAKCPQPTARRCDDLPIPSRGGHDLAMIMFTSGSTGRPKGVMLSHRNLLSNARSILEFLPIRNDDRALVVLPFYHAFGNSILQTHLLSGATLILDGSLVIPASMTQALCERQATSFSAVPELFAILMRLAPWQHGTMPHLRYMTVAGGALRPELADQISQQIAPADFYVMYGQTEGTARLAYLPPQTRLSHRDSIGKAIPGVELRIVDENGAAAAAREVGMLQARGDNIMLGYWLDSQGTAEVLRDGWLSTGDLATVDESGFIYLRGRSNRLVKLQGNRIHPAEIENVVAYHFPGTQVVVLPYEAENLTRLALFCAPHDNASLTERDIYQVCLRQLPYYKVPQHIEVLDRLPLNGGMKVDRVELARRLTSAFHKKSPLSMNVSLLDVTSFASPNDSSWGNVRGM